ncbi:hypothetical protein OTK49_02140 [Vibrio coralliirubri]|uniref:hypothetical protein n=1 Tax=Vibrio coralliirubri TaxID=1516159 RepID=UPI00228484B9|nr:hypothetical protein [Vibrio coralliirubri]MCY9861315.1 hypothetical protein [Vibrio coralliirubri]
MSKIDFYETLQRIAGEDAAKEIAGGGIGIKAGDPNHNNVKTAIQNNEMPDKTVNPLNTLIHQPSPYRRTSFRV